MIIENAKQASETPHVDGIHFCCSQCGEVKPVQSTGGTGYARNRADELVCYACCAVNDRADMIATGKATLYLTCEPRSKERLHWRPFTPSTLSQGTGRSTRGKVSNWPGTLSFDCFTRTGNHNIAGTRYDCWFIGPDGFEWHGVTFGDNTQICHCKRTKTKKQSA